VFVFLFVDAASEHFLVEFDCVGVEVVEGERAEHSGFVQLLESAGLEAVDVHEFGVVLVFHEDLVHLSEVEQFDHIAAGALVAVDKQVQGVALVEAHVAAAADVDEGLDRLVEDQRGLLNFEVEYAGHAHVVAGRNHVRDLGVPVQVGDFVVQMGVLVFGAALVALDLAVLQIVDDDAVRDRGDQVGLDFVDLRLADRVEGLAAAVLTRNHLQFPILDRSQVHVLLREHQLAAVPVVLQRLDLADRFVEGHLIDHLRVGREPVFGLLQVLQIGIIL